ncbi:sulfatase-like hydrolase/transferase [Natronohydrobacter thiooxidans]|uniref:sulfatase-like hydrolase/transferase n=1 Tax=Natronohydrobacter thiooxidans TaxID=87172 RepID=UPI000A418714|nr:sulfatase-like hydrolase/transferase [Natronohydrobacter thiooxidans]
MSLEVRPHIIFILSDQHNPNLIGAAGHPYVRTPHIDQLLASGISLENCYCASPLCVPSRASLLSGRLPSHTGVYNNLQALRSDEPTFVHALAVAGYETTLVGRMHFNGPDQRHGYMNRLVGDITPSAPGRGLRERQYGDLTGTPGQSRIAIEKSGGGNSAVLQFDRAVTDAAIAHLADRKTSDPIFMTVGYYGPHCPFVAPPDFFRHYFNALPIPEMSSETEKAGRHPAIRQWIANRGVENVTAAELHRVRAAYCGMVEYLDGLIGEVLGAAERYLGTENVLIVYTSDHGESLGAHGLFWKSNFYEESARVPLVFSWPGTIPAGRTTDALTSLLDVAPTFLSLAGATSLPQVDGVDLSLGLRRGALVDDGRVVISELADIKGDSPSAMIRQGRWKLVKHHGYENVQLFDLENDAAETDDLGCAPELAPVRDGLLSILGQYWDGDRAQKSSHLAQMNGAVLRDFARKTDLAGCDEWYGDQAGNFITV